MTWNYVQPGGTVALIAPYDRGVGEGALVGALFGVSLQTVLSGEQGEFATCGVWTLAATSAQAWTQGQKVYWNVGTKLADSTEGVGPLVGVAASAKVNPSSTGLVRLNEAASGVSASGVLALRARVTIAQINAGLELLPALAGKAYRLVDAFAIAVGGAAAAVTTVDLLGTLSGSRKLVAWAQASLTQSALLRAGGTGAAILADGASFVANDPNTPITVGKTGADVTTATHIDIQICYQVV